MKHEKINKPTHKEVFEKLGIVRTVEPMPVVEAAAEPRKEWIPEPPKYAVLVEISPKDIERIVSMALADGWKLAGGLVTVTESGTTRWAQAVTK